MILKLNLLFPPSSKQQNRNKMNIKNIFTLILIVAINTLSFGQRQKEFDPEKKAKALTEKMTEKLELSEDQAKAVYNANLKMLQEKEALHEQMKAQKEAHKEALAKVLDKEQMAKIEKKMERKGKAHKKRFKKRKNRKSEKAKEKTEVEDQ